MNLTNFLKQSDVPASQYSAEQLADFIHGIGRVYPEHRREDFLERLKFVGSKAGEAPDKATEKDTGFDEMSGFEEFLHSWVTFLGDKTVWCGSTYFGSC